MAEILTKDGGRSNYPCGTRAEVMERGLDPRFVATCSQPIDNVNAGCVYFNSKTDQCIFAHVRNAESGPVNIGFYKRFGRKEDPNKIEQGFYMPCYLFMGNEFQLWQQQHLSHRLMSYSQFLNEGDEITRRIHKPLHPEIDPKCHNCRSGTCSQTQQIDVTETIPAFRRPAEAISESLFPSDGEPEDPAHFDLARKTEDQPKTGAQLDEIIAQRRKSRQITERTSGQAGT